MPHGLPEGCANQEPSLGRSEPGEEAPGPGGEEILVSAMHGDGTFGSVTEENGVSQPELNVVSSLN